ncbi:UNVERIFIED_CONTAM: hypothetical protein PYX00_009197 [Menopon gallinae]|uniref:Gustatory receptor n=1 Tax=Menopon gallinae TaxID=328185 RepID=A0AAW2HAD8_9NEOP
MFDYSDDEVSNKFITSRSRRKSGMKRRSKNRDDLREERTSAFGYANENFISDFGLVSGEAQPRELITEAYPPARIPDNHLNVIPLFKPRPLTLHTNRRGFPPQSNVVDHPDSFFKSIKVAVQMAQLFSLLPVTGYGGPNYKSVTFRWVHWKTIYFAIYLVGNTFILFCTALRSFSYGFTYDKSTGLVFFASSLMASLLLLQLATNWKKVNSDFAEMEFKLYKYNYPNGISKRFRIFTYVFMVLALVEHILSRVAQMQREVICSKDGSVISVVEAFIRNYYMEVFTYISFSLWIGIVLVILQFLCTFTWNFADLLLGLIGWTISSRFKLFNQALFKVQGQDRDSSFWKMTRMDYNELTDLTRKVDSYIQKLMLLSLGDNLYFICIQLLKGLNSNRKSGNIYETAYFLWSVGFLIIRTCFVTFTAAGIHDESKEAKTVLYSIPESSYCAETRRFLTQLSTNDVALTGCKFFSITRGLILTIAGTIVTYEVILVQFNTGDEDLPADGNNTYCMNF